jgi:hypothetical protein
MTAVAWLHYAQGADLLFTFLNLEPIDLSVPWYCINCPCPPQVSKQLNLAHVVLISSDDGFLRWLGQGRSANRL